MVVFIGREISVGLCVYQYDIEEVESILLGLYFPSRVSVHQHLQRSNSFPINALRNLAIQDVHTSHLFIADIDIIPSCAPFLSLSHVANLREEFLSLPVSALQDPYLAVIVPLFETYFSSQPCQLWSTCEDALVKN